MIAAEGDEPQLLCRAMYTGSGRPFVVKLHQDGEDFRFVRIEDLPAKKALSRWSYEWYDL